MHIHTETHACTGNQNQIKSLGEKNAKSLRDPRKEDMKLGGRSVGGRGVGGVGEVGLI